MRDHSRLHLRTRLKYVPLSLLFFCVLKTSAKIQSIPPSTVWDASRLRIQADSLYLKGEKALNEGRKSLSVDFLKQALIYDPGAGHLLLKLGEIYTREGLWAEAVRQYERILEKDPFSRSAHSRLAEIYAFNSLIQKALLHYGILREQNPKNFPFSLQYSLLLIQEKNWPSALTALKEAEKRAIHRDQRVEVLLAEFSVYDFLNRPLEQKKRLEQARALKPEREDLTFQIASLYVRLGDFSQAVHVLKDYQKRRPLPSLQTTRALTGLLMALNRKTEALHQLLRLKSVGGLNRELNFYLSALLIERGQADRAVPFLKDLMAHPPFPRGSRYLLGLAYEKQGRVPQALQEYKNISTESPYFVPGCMQQARILQDQGKPRKALAPLKRAFSRNNRSSSIAGRIGELYYELKDLKNSRVFFEKAAVLERDHKKQREIQKRIRSLSAQI